MKRSQGRGKTIKWFI